VSSGQREPIDLIRDLVKERVSGDPMAEAMGFDTHMVDSLDDMALAALPDAGIV